MCFKTHSASYKANLRPTAKGGDTGLGHNKDIIESQVMMAKEPHPASLPCGDGKEDNTDSIPRHMRAYIFGSHKNPARCCEYTTLSLRELVSRLQHSSTCPVCGESFGYVQDGAIDEAVSGDGRDDSPGKQNEQYVYFKYNKLHFRLSVASSSAMTATRRPSGLWRSLFGGRISDNPFLETTAQGRIRSALGLSNAMKVSR